MGFRPEFRKCTVFDCNLSAYASGVCKKHHTKINKNIGVSGLTSTDRLTEEQRKEIIRRRDRFQSPTKIAKEMGLSANSVYDTIKAYNKKKGVS